MKKLMLGLVGVFALSAGFAQDMMMKSGYVEYSQKAFDDAVKMKRVLFFAASWCPSCRGADKDINENLKKIPSNVVIFKTDYDTQTALKTKYGITRQHSFVYVDAKGAALKKWSGGGLAEIVKAVDSMK
jgi:thioredoxin 1